MSGINPTHCLSPFIKLTSLCTNIDFKTCLHGSLHSWLKSCSFLKSMNVSIVTRFIQDKEKYVLVLFQNCCMCLTQKRCAFSKLLISCFKYVFQSSQPYKAFGNTIVSHIVLTIIGFTDVTSIPPFTTLK